ncbi:MAG: 50S ribosomal protein L6 [Candidatus Nanoarchaeia archaeon]|nr:50S ribosomal protein L6 [Candidatus Nanoarchaeia archaeon]
MKKEISEKMEIPEGIEIVLEGNFIIAKGSQGENKKKFDLKNLQVHKEHNHLTIGCKKATKNEKKRINTLMAHLKNMIDGVSKKFEYRLKICYSHFPITAEVKGREMIIKNFMGERANRKLKILEGADVDVDKEIIIVKSVNKEIAGQMSADIEKNTKINKKDRRVFQDGIFITSKAGEEI